MGCIYEHGAKYLNRICSAPGKTARYICTPQWSHCQKGSICPPCSRWNFLIQNLIMAGVEKVNCTQGSGWSVLHRRQVSVWGTGKRNSLKFKVKAKSIFDFRSTLTTLNNSLHRKSDYFDPEF